MKRPIIAVLLTILLFSAHTTFAQNDDNALDAECRDLMTSTSDNTPDAPSVRIVQPAANDVVQGGQVVVTIETSGFDLADGGHWHI